MSADQQTFPISPTSQNRPWTRWVSLTALALREDDPFVVGDDRITEQLGTERV